MVTREFVAPRSWPARAATRPTVEARRGHHRNAGGDPAAVKGDPDGSRTLFLPEMRDVHATADAVSYNPTKLCRPKPARDGAVREVRATLAAEPAERALCVRRDRLSLSTLADHVGACAAVLAPLHALIEPKVLAAQSLGRPTPARRRHGRSHYGPGKTVTAA